MGEGRNKKEKKSIPTKTPEETIPLIIDYFKSKDIKALGIGSFGPVDVVKGSPTFGHILNTPKLAWKGYDIYGEIKKALNVPIGIDTDVNGSCLGEITYGASKGLTTVAYFTIGTGIGGGFAVNGQLVHGMMHPEAGHFLIQRNPNDPGKSVCPYHDSCFEGLASGPSIEARWGKPAKELVGEEKVWELESEYIAKGLVNVIMILSPQRIILGGGVMHQEQLFPMIRAKVKEYINNYYVTKELEDIDNYIVPASLNDDQGIMGAIRLGELALQEA